MRNAINNNLADSIVSNYYRPKIGLEGKPNEVADFCLNKCPHSNKPCKGTCEEYREFARKYYKTTRKEEKDAL